MTSNDDILVALARLEAQQEGLSKTIDRLSGDFAEERRQAHDSRSRIHERLDEQAHRIGESEKTLVAAGATVAQQRDVILTLKETVEKNHAATQPALEEWRRMKTIGYGISGLIAFAGLTIGGVIAYMSDGAVAALRHWLKIN